MKPRRNLCKSFFLLSLPVLAAGVWRVEAAPHPRQQGWRHEDGRTVLLGLGDSTVHGTMDGTNNATNTKKALLQRVADSLSQVMPVRFSQPLLGDDGKRLHPFRLPTNLGVDGADAFSMEGFEYYKRVGADESFLTHAYLCDRIFPWALSDKYDKVMYPLNLLARKDVSQVDAALWHLNRNAVLSRRDRVLIIQWVGNNDSSSAALGSGGENPTFLPIPFRQIEKELSPTLRALFHFGERTGLLSFAPYTQEAIERNLTEVADFRDQYERLIHRLEIEGNLYASRVNLVLLTLPYYSSVGYLFDSEDLEFYLQKLDPAYTVPPSFERVSPPGVPITDFTRGDRVSLLTFGFMYLLLSGGHSVEEVNAVLEDDGVQRNEIVLSEDEQRFIIARIDAFNAAIEELAAGRDPQVRLIDLGQFLNDALTGKTTVEVGGRQLNRKWIRGGAFSLDGVHAGYTAQALIANFLLERLNPMLGVDAPLVDLPEILETDPYVDRDGDGWAPGPSYQASGITELLFLFRDPSDLDATLQPEMPPNVWQRVSEILLGEIVGIEPIAIEAESLGVDVEALRR